MQPSKAKKAKANARPWTDIWGEVWLERRPAKYDFNPWWRSSRDALALAEACGNDADTFRRVCSAFHDAEDGGRQWPDRQPTLSKALHFAPDLLNAQPVAAGPGDYAGHLAAKTVSEREAIEAQRAAGRANAIRIRAKRSAALDEQRANPET